MSTMSQGQCPSTENFCLDWSTGASKFATLRGSDLSSVFRVSSEHNAQRYLGMHVVHHWSSTSFQRILMAGRSRS